VAYCGSKAFPGRALRDREYAEFTVMTIWQLWIFGPMIDDNKGKLIESNTIIKSDKSVAGGYSA
jgi:hypothetical protein